MAALTPIPCSRTSPLDNTAGLVAAGAGGDSFPASANNFLRVKNGNAAACTVTVTPPAGGGPLGGTVAPQTFVIPATTGDKTFGPFPANPYADVNGNVQVTYSVTATVTVCVQQMADF